MIFAIVSSVILLLIVIKFLTKRLHLKKVDKIIAKIHGKLWYILIVAVVIHMVLALFIFDSRPLYIYILGALATVCIVLAAASYIFRKQLGKKWITCHRVIAVVLCLVVVVHIGSALFSVISYQKEVSRIDISEIDISQVPEGIYEGEYDVKYIYAKVAVTVKNGKITNIEILEHRNERGSSAESITSQIIDKQNINVDAVSGATNSSKVIKKAVENAFVNIGK